jgi:murein DD-endopeptidase MepM/ murein hydrolase activator NlpD
MRDRYHTIIVVPHSRAKLRKWQITPRQLKVGATMLAFATLGAGAVGWLALTRAVDRNEVVALKRENAALKEVNQTFGATLERLQQQLVESEDRTRKLAIVAGIDAEAVAGRAGIGGATDSYESHLQSLEARSLAIGNRLDQVEQQFDERSVLLSATPTVAPVKGLYTSAFGHRRDPFTGRSEFHPGIDIAAPGGHPVLAPADGVVLRAGVNGGLGRSTSLSHGFGLATVYGHLSRVAVEPGQRIRRGEVIGYVGNTGRSTGYHLHYEVHVDGEPVDPVRYILDGAR